MARVYHRDANGRFASGGGGSPARPARKAAPTRAGNRLNRDNAGKITGVGKDGATARGGRLRTASGNRRATQTARLSKVPGVARKGSGVMKTTVMNPGSKTPGQGSIAQTLRGTLRSLAEADARFYREIESITGMPLRAPKGPTAAGERVRGTAKSTGKVGKTLRAGLRELAQGDARMFREMQDIVNTPKGALGGSSGGRKRIGGGKPQLPPGRKPRRKKS